jgi:hypothetical protein
MDVNITDDDFFGKTQKVGKTYYSSDPFFEDLGKGDLIDGFMLTEQAFQEIVGSIAADKQVAEIVNNNALLIVIKADKQQELGGILEIAESYSNG